MSCLSLTSFNNFSSFPPSAPPFLTSINTLNSSATPNHLSLPPYPNVQPTATMNQVEDVEIVLAHDRRYKFHAGTLARNSTLLATMLIEPTAVKLSKAAKSAGITTRWMIELKEMPSSQQLAGRLGIVVSSSYFTFWEKYPECCRQII
jgi:hypothetical protein